MLKVSGLNQFYGQSHILWDVGLDVPEAACTCLMGRNGVGKTTLLRSIMGVLPIASGQIRFDGEDIAGLSPDQRTRRGIGYVPQGRDIFPQLSVEENLRVGLAGRRDAAKKIPELVYELFPVLDEMLARRGGDLSGGQQQQLAIGRALVSDPKLLILDEPCEGIQPNIVRQIGDVVIRLNEAGITVLLVEQKLPFARRVSDSFAIMERGRTVAKGEMQALSDQLIQDHLTV